MTAQADPPDDAPKAGKKGGKMLGIVLALVGAVGGFAVVWMEIITLETSESHPEETEHAAEVTPLGPASFVALDPIVVNLPNNSGHDLLRFAAHLEVAPNYVEDIESIKPRIVDVLNSYLRAVDIVDLSDPSALVRLRSQMLRRVQVVAGNARVTDLLITEFVLN